MFHTAPTSSLLTRFILVVALLVPLISMATPKDVSTPRAAIPPNIVTTANRPMMALITSKDHTLFGPVYSDFEDLDEDGILDITFKPDFTYYGYFDATKCYIYSTGSNQFEPAVMATDTVTTPNITVKGISNTVTRHTYSCSDSAPHWSGNFLNWATMTRMDVVRKMLYGGRRSTDASGNTVLERANLSKDAHSFVKYYKGDDIRKYTPFSVSDLTKTTGSNPKVYAGLSICNRSDQDNDVGNPIIHLAKGNYRMWATTAGTVCEWDATFWSKLAIFYKDADKGNGGIAHELGPVDKLTDGASYKASGVTIGPELTVRVKVCDPSLLGSERCTAYPRNSATNYKPVGLLQDYGMPENAGGAVKVEFAGFTGSYDRNLVAGALRKTMGDFSYEIDIGTGRFCHLPTTQTLTDRSGACTNDPAYGRGLIQALDHVVLYGRNGGYDREELAVDLAKRTQGTLAAWGNPIGEMVVQALQYYAGITPSTNPSSISNDNSKGINVVGWDDPLSNANVSRKNNYGNAMCRPMYNLVVSSSALSFDGDASAAFDSLKNLDHSLAEYTDIIGSSTNENINGSPRSVGSVIGGGFTGTDARAYGENCSSKLVTTLSKVSGICPEAPAVGGTFHVAGAALHANTHRIRNVDVATMGAEPSDLATLKDALKVKTMAASLQGGAARIEVLIPKSKPSDPSKYVYITPEGLWAHERATARTAGVLNFPAIASGTNSYGYAFGSFMVSWNDTLFGADYDMDLVGFLRYDILPAKAPSTKLRLQITTDIVSADASDTGTHGFSVLGTNFDGRYLTHRYNDDYPTIDFPDTRIPIETELNASQGYLCANSAYRTQADLTKFIDSKIPPMTGSGIDACLFAAWPIAEKNTTVTTTFEMIGVDSSTILQDPLWYAAKYGSFDSAKSNNTTPVTYTTLAQPPDIASWDKYRSDGSTGSDGVPDGYFLARRPDLLETQLRRTLDDVASKSNATPAVSSARLVEGNYKYVARFDPSTFSGDVQAFKVDDQGNFSTTATWSAGNMLACRMSGTPTCSGIAKEARTIITNSGNGANAGLPFQWASLPTGYQAQLTTSSTNVLSAANAEIAINYVRGDQTYEQLNQLRSRGVNLMGAVVSSTPLLQGPPSANYGGSAYKGYTDFAKDQKDRAKLLWVGANDGMLHALNPDSGKEMFAYVPGVLANRLAELPLQRNGSSTLINNEPFVTGAENRPTGTIWPYVDGSPFVGDVRLGSDPTTATKSNWRSYLLGALGRGGKGVFALDVTNPAVLSSESSDNAKAIFKWQFTSDDDSALGYISSDFSSNNSTRQPMPIAQLNNGKFAFLIGNGNKSSTGDAALFILFVDGPNATNGTWNNGVEYIKLTAAVGPDNGLAQVTWLDLNEDGKADAVYAGDLKGNLWKFDLSSSTQSNWRVAYNQPLFTTKYSTTTAGSSTPTINTLPITTAPEYTYGPFDGPVILFGTGNSFETDDYPNTVVNQSMFAIWDDPSYEASSLPMSVANLVARTYVRDVNGNVKLSDSPDEGLKDVNWSLKKGWYAKLPGKSEMIVSDPDLRARVLVFTTIRPPDTAANTCTNRPVASLFAVDPLSGLAKRAVLGGTSSGGIPVGITIDDQKVRITNDNTTRSFRTTVSCIRNSSADCTCVGNTCTKPVVPTCANGQKSPRIVGETTDKSLCLNQTPRQQWREIPGLRTDK